MKYNLYVVINIIFLFVILFLNIFILINVFHRESDTKENIDTDNLIKSYYLENMYFNSIIDDNLNINHLKNDSLKSLNFNKPILVLYFTAASCTSCIDFTIDNLKKHSLNQNEKVQILYVAAKYKTNMNFEHKNVINIQKNKLGLSAEDMDIPFLFIWDNGISKNIFIPDNNYPEYMNQYLDVINKKYFQY